MASSSFLSPAISTGLVQQEGRRRKLEYCGKKKKKMSSAAGLMVWCCGHHGNSSTTPPQNKVVRINGGGSNPRFLKKVRDFDSTRFGFEEGLGIVGFLKWKKFFITGGTGFLAKVLIEKILRAAPDVGKIYVLIKAKNKEEAMNRMLSEILEAELFQTLKKAHGRDYQAFMLSKLVAVPGNVREPNLGIHQELADEISREVDVIVNSAANTTFDERYDVALDINTIGPRRLMGIAKTCKKLKLFLQVSTAYVNGQRKGRVLERPFCMGESIAREEVIDSIDSMDSLPMLDVEEEIRLAFDLKRTLEEDDSNGLEMKELGLQRARSYGWQDTYVFTKAMGEMVLDSMRGDIPIVMMRPSVIESTCREPFPGWMEGNRMMDPIVLYYGKGQLTGFMADPNGVLDVVPADMVVNATLAAIAKHGRGGNAGMHVYHISSSVTNPLVFGELATLIFKHFTSFPYMDNRGRPIYVTKMKLFHNMNEFSSHLSEDAISRVAATSTLNGKLLDRLKIICMKAVEQAKYLATIYQPYTFYNGRFDNANTEMLMESMSEDERRSFGFDVGSIDWEEYISNVHIPGLRRHVMKGRGSSMNSQLVTNQQPVSSKTSNKIGTVQRRFACPLHKDDTQ